MMALWFLLLLIGLALPPNAQAAGEALAEVDGVAITADEVEKSLAGQLSKLEEQIYNLKRQKLDALINETKFAPPFRICAPKLLKALSPR
jgi:hypothetical protein